MPQPASLVDLPLAEDKFQPAVVVPFVVPPGTQPRLVSQSLTLAKESDSSLLQQSALQAAAPEVELIPPVSIRGIQIAKLVVPQVVTRGSGLAEVERAEVSIAFVGTPAPSRPLTDSPFNQMLSQTVANWSQARAWGAGHPTSLAADAYDPFSHSNNWVRISVSTTGLYSISRTDLSTAGVAVASIDPASFRLFTLGGRTLPLTGSAARDSLTEMAILVEDEDGLFAGDDRLLFAATGPDFWYYDDGMRFNHNPYNSVNIYYLTWGGSFPGTPRRMTAVDQIDPPLPLDTLTEFVDCIHLEENNSLGARDGEIDDYYTWYWRTDTDFTLNFNLPDGVSGAENLLVIGVDGTVESALLNSVEGLEEDSLWRPLYFYTTDNLQTGLNQLELSIGSWFGEHFTDYLELHYRRPLTKSAGSALSFFTPATATMEEPVAYRIAGASGDHFLVDATDPHSQRLLSFATASGSLTFTSTVTDSSGQMFLLAAEADLLSPAQLLVTEIDDLRSTANGADLIIITHGNFYNQSLEFAQYRQSHDGLRARVVRIRDVYAQFSGGLVDPVAIRDFLGYSYRNWSGGAPSYCLLVGDGVYDFRDYLGTGAVNYIPPYIVPDDETVSDENFVYFDQLGDLDNDNSFDTTTTPVDRGVDMVIARWPVSSA
ncbi:MAG: C25 family cysteine peptidase, partial [bacterium]